MAIHWIIVDHICRQCSGRILQSVANVGSTGGGNPLFRCANCGASSASLGPESVCWCGMTHRGSSERPYLCASKAAHPEWQSEFEASGCWESREEIGIVSEAGVRRLAKGE